MVKRCNRPCQVKTGLLGVFHLGDAKSAAELEPNPSFLFGVRGSTVSLLRSAEDGGEGIGRSFSSLSTGGSLIERTQVDGCKRGNDGVRRPVPPGFMVQS